MTPIARVLAFSAIGGIAAYVAIDTVLAVVDPAVTLFHNPESDYGVGAFAWLMDLNFMIRCALSLCAACAIALSIPSSAARQVGTAGLATWAVCSGLLAFFPDQPSSTGRVHLLLALIAFTTIIIGSVSLSIGLKAQGLIAVAGAGCAAYVILFLTARSGYVGLTERLFLGLELVWIAGAAANVSRQRRRREQQERPRG